MAVERELIEQKRLFGVVAEYDGEAGWIKPNKPLAHDLAVNNDGRVFFMAEDVEQELTEGEGGEVSFFVYSDGHILGASSVKPAPKRKGKGEAKGSGKGSATGDERHLPRGAGTLAAASAARSTASGGKGKGEASGKGFLGAFGAKAQGQYSKGGVEFHAAPRMPAYGKGYGKEAGPAYGKGYGGAGPYGAGLAVGGLASSRARAGGYGAGPASPYGAAPGYGAAKGQSKGAHAAPGRGAYGGAAAPARVSGLRGGPAAVSQEPPRVSGLRAGYGQPPPAAYADVQPEAPGGESARSKRGGRKKKERPLEDRVHDLLHESIWTAMETVKETETEWDEKEFHRRMMKYFTKGTSGQNLINLPWTEAVSQIVDGCMQSYSAACGDKPWFFDLDLTSPLSLSAWEVVRSGRDWQHVNHEQVAQHTVRLYEETMDGILLDKAIWEISMATFDDEKLCNKLLKALNTAHKKAFEEAMSMPRHVAETERMEGFMHKWIESSMGRAWNSIDSEGTILNDDTVSQLFQGLVVPFGEEHPFSCIPAALMPNVGRPSADWPFVLPTVATIFAEFREESLNAPTSKRARKGKRRGNADGAEAEGEYDPESGGLA